MNSATARRAGLRVRLYFWTRRPSERERVEHLFMLYVNISLFAHLNSLFGHLKFPVISEQGIAT